MPASVGNPKLCSMIPVIGNHSISSQVRREQCWWDVPARKTAAKRWRETTDSTLSILTDEQTVPVHFPTETIPTRAAG